MREQLHIGEVAALVGVSPKTIRYYHEVGLLAEPARTEAGYRLYTAQDLLRLQRIRRLRALGLPLERIKEILGKPDREHEPALRHALQALVEELSAQILELRSGATGCNNCSRRIRLRRRRGRASRRAHCILMWPGNNWAATFRISVKSNGGGARRSMPCSARSTGLWAIVRRCTRWCSMSPRSLTNTSSYWPSKSVSSRWPTNRKTRRK